MKEIINSLIGLSSFIVAMYFAFEGNLEAEIIYLFACYMIMRKKENEL